MRENWKDIPGYEGFYQVSDLGRVRGVDRIVMRNNGRQYTARGKILSQQKSNGYWSLKLHKHVSRKRWKTHQLVGLAFLNHTPKENGLVVHHKDNKRTDNRLSNLDIIPHGENVMIGKRLKQQNIQL